MRRLLALALLPLAACNDMVDQPRQDSYAASELYPDGKAMQAPPDGVVDREAGVRAAEAQRPPLTAALIARGRERYGIDCAPCHGIDGRGAGVVVQRGFPAPRSFLGAGEDLSSAHLFGVIGDGKGVMYGFADRVRPSDRWAIAAYVRALAASQGGGDGR